MESQETAPATSDDGAVITFSTSKITGEVWSIIARHWRELVGFTLVFRLFESLFCAPLTALVGKWLLGRTVLDSTAVVSFLLSWRGFAALLLGATMVLTIRLLEHAGLAAIFFGGFTKRRASSHEALGLVARHFTTLVRVAARFVGVILLIALPLLLVIGGFAAWLLPRHDVNYYLKFRPREFLVAGAGIGVVALITTAAIVALVVRWRWVVQAVLFEHMPTSEGFRRSAVLTLGMRGKLTVVL